jgi:hypothetical protein
MLITRVRVAGTVLALGTMFASVHTAAANGINPPRLKSTAAIAASCYEKPDGPELEILRARVRIADETTDALSLKLGNANEKLALVNIESLVLTGSAVDRSGYRSAKLRRKGDSTEQAAAVQVRANGVAVRLSGFTRTGSSVAIDLTSCSKVTFSTVGDPDRESSPVMKK